MGSVYAAAMAVYGCPIAGAAIVPMSHGYLLMVRRAVTQEIGLEILEAARPHPSAAVRKSVEKNCKYWIQAASRSTWPVQYPRWPKPNSDE